MGKRLGPNGTLIDAVMGNEQLMQLAWWQDQADNWPLHLVIEKGGIHVRCFEGCSGLSVMSIRGQFKLSELTSQTVAHLRQFHRDLGVNGREDDQVGNRNDLPRNRGSVPNPASGHEAQE